ncbi:sporulation integral membrane protein YtvI [Psychrobacillus psychrodurans]|uniref:sporulation integral membrane protein YtvI n=1 Tax=Psychrobacillus psychrodurans TaxID=126157 RepID=UPI001F4EE2A5|nr:sporulation integral membrane protein YtvI [Psychrobacillus psychrodurans]MCK1996285.1 sporulation integral membrane protein YtvI [Psychrobacillus psychrodurans]
MVLNFFKKEYIKYIVLVFILLLLTIFILPVSIPIILALLTAIIMEPVVKFTQKTFKWKRKPAVITNFVLFIIVISGLLYLVITKLISQLIHISQTIPTYINNWTGLWINMQNNIFKYTEGLPTEVVVSIQSKFDATLESMRDALLDILSYNNISTLLTNIPNFLVSFIVFIIALFLFMLDLQNLQLKFFHYLSDNTAGKVRFMFSNIKKVAIGFMKAQIIASFIILGAAFIGLLLIITPKYALIMAIVIWIIDIIPILGSIAVLAPWAIYHYLTGDMVLGTKLTILAVVLLVIRRAIEPKLMGSQMGISPLAILIAMFIGAKLFGFIGFMIGPLVVIIFITAKESGMLKLNFKI